MPHVDIPAAPIPLGDLADDLSLRLTKQSATVRRRHTGDVERFTTWRTARLNAGDVRSAIRFAAEAADRPLLVIFDRATDEARAALRSERISYASTAGELFFNTKHFLIDRPALPRPPGRTRADDSHTAAPPVGAFSRRGQRIVRRLLLDHTEPRTITQLAAHADLSRPFTSQVVRALADDTFVDVHPDPSDGRSRLVTLRDPARLLDAWAREWQRRRLSVATWDIGTTGFQDTCEEWLDATTHADGAAWALGGTAAAAAVVGGIEPADVLVWIDPAEADRWADLLVPDRVRAGRGRLRIAAAPDPWTLTLANSVNGVWISDLAQIYVDCQREGERAQPAAAALRERLVA